MLYHIFSLLAVIYLTFTTPLCAADISKQRPPVQTLALRENLKQAKAGDYLVTSQGKNYAILYINSKDGENLSVEEITVPSTRISTKAPFSWRKWIEEGAKGNTCDILYNINLNSGTIQQAFSYTRNEWVTVPQSQNFLSTLLNLALEPIPEEERKKVGPPPASDKQDRRATWQPNLIVDGQAIAGVTFDGWRTRWPKDGGELSGKLIEIYVPRDSTKYPAYFPYWLQITGMVGKAKVRIVDSGSGLKRIL